MSVEKDRFAKKMQAMAELAAAVVAQCRDLVKVYFARGYDGSGADPIVNADVAGLELTAADVSAGITFAQQMVALADNAAVTESDYAATLAKLRTDL